MEMRAPGQVTQLLHDWSDGDSAALEQLMPIIYGELRSLAGRYLRHERRDHTLQPTALVHEAFFRLVNQNDVDWQSRAHFFGIAAQMMRRVLIDHARFHHRGKRGAGLIKVDLDQAEGWSEEQADEIVALHEALEGLARIDPRKARTVELRYFGGLSVEETAEVLGLSPNTVTRDWTLAKAWLFNEIKGGGSNG
jgi:RNA polymerase sigma factor (TIGR02999 family)